MATTKIAIINASNVLTDDEIAVVIPALQTQVDRDFGPVWGCDADLAFVAQGTVPVPGSWWITVLDNSDQAGALGYHDLTPEGLPLGKVFAGTDLAYGSQWTITLSHELLEMLADPDINLAVFVQPDALSGFLYMHEICDACEADQYGYAIDGVPVSDFVFPAWYESFRAGGAWLFDQANLITNPFQLLPGGYIGIFDVILGTGWQQLTADQALNGLDVPAVRQALRQAPNFRYEMLPRVGSRRERRRKPRYLWRRSELS